MLLRLITYNIHKGIGGVDRRYQPQRVIETLAHYHADVIFLQEVDDGVPRSGHHRQVDLLGDALGMPHRAFQQNVKLRRGHYGNAILSRFPLSDVHDLELTVPLKKRRRALLAHCRVQDEQHSRTLLLINVHLGLAGYERQMQVRRILACDALAHTRGDTPTLLGGDCNDTFGRLGKKLLAPAGFQEASKKSRTFPAVLPVQPLDRIYYRGNLQLENCFVSRAKIARQASDHLPLIAEFIVLQPGAES